MAKLAGLAADKKFDGAALLYWTSDGQPPDAKSNVLGEALAIDNGEPGRDDFFEIAATDGNSLVSLGGGFLAGGNIQMHGKCA
jgi:hypothetical protein